MHRSVRRPPRAAGWYENDRGHGERGTARLRARLPKVYAEHEGLGATAMQLSNYLFFTTTCEEALAFYAQCGLGRVVEVLRYGANGMPVKNEAMRGKIMHAKFEGPGLLRVRQR